VEIIPWKGIGRAVAVVVVFAAGELAVFAAGELVVFAAGELVVFAAGEVWGLAEGEGDVLGAAEAATGAQQARAAMHAVTM
jgi:hypothetical protein